MTELASRQQLRMSFVRWALVTVPAVLLLGFLSGSSAPAGAGNAWYAALARPAITPPDWVFPAVWTVLYVPIGVALAMILNARGARFRGAAVALFVAQLVANLVWQPLFFGGHRVMASFAVLVGMIVLSFAATWLFARIRPAAAWLMVPYLAWLCFAGVLVWRIHQLNPDAESLVPPAAITQIAL